MTREALAEAWDEGFNAGYSSGAADMNAAYTPGEVSVEPNPPNPYRLAAFPAVSREPAAVRHAVDIESDVNDPDCLCGESWPHPAEPENLYRFDTEAERMAFREGARWQAGQPETDYEYGSVASSRANEKFFMTAVEDQVRLVYQHNFLRED